MNLFYYESKFKKRFFSLGGSGGGSGWSKCICFTMNSKLKKKKKDIFFFLGGGGGGGGGKERQGEGG